MPKFYERGKIDVIQKNIYVKQILAKFTNTNLKFPRNLRLGGIKCTGDI